MSDDARDYEELGLVAGLEIHQQLDTETKLFCESPTELREPEEATHTITRELHPTRSELGELDEAAMEESRVDRTFEYLAYDTTCLVEEDDEPPARIDEEALEVAMSIADLLDADVVDQAHVMRKLVIDGSNTSGFQRSMLLAQNGEIETSEGSVGIVDVMLEEESAQRVEETEEGVRYSLDRLGIPLVEIGTAPDISTPEQAYEAAEHIGMLLRSTGSVKRGLGTIRQDVNVSIAEGARVEIKGVQALGDIRDIVANEVDRQVELLEIRDELDARGAAVGEVSDVSEAFADTDSGVIRGALDSGGKVTAVPLYGFDGLVGREIQPDRRLGTELSDHAKRAGAGGIFHTDELPAYGVTEDEVESLREAVDAGEDDAVAIVAAGADVADQAIEAAADRARSAIEGVPEETRGANDDGTTRYLRPLPGAARMYPETDVPPVEPDPSEVETPELLTERVERYADELGLDEGLAEQVAFGRRMVLFEEAVEAGVDPTFAASTLESTLTELSREGVDVASIREDALLNTLLLVEDGDLPKEGVNPVLTALAEDPDLTPEDAMEEAGVGGVGEDEVREAVQEVVERNAEQVEEEGMGAFSGLMGECMGALRGQAGGDLVSEVLREEIQKRA
ncbi:MULTISPECIES: Glu-tRNA(Gln) amidotransferase subunit GatE [Halolamina]|uniref:Glutamyl-tRNA(Gln) amidotransferase subunit E n=1 Tax=Halolamina pelagica TaxID=699431 RepID=A0A1I5QT55_9EURY|nr:MULTISPECIES: Glu-tRNA(Gln) amidotransferase subunit GatE [Halolamina]NHX35521.1 Glu-tRNA(Gln) amidotransferase subunit GatE [Halolamina sp. R1-12]SFP49221.1 glutamyl-tRNA(Gln) amidotransferase subunit E [Halolamina pelagica]